MMIDLKKRNTLKTVVAGAAWTSMPLVASGVSTAMADCAHHQSPSSTNLTHATARGLELELDSIPDSDSIWVRFTNVTNQPVTVRHVNPGVVQFADKDYDVNSVFDGVNSFYHGVSLTINPDESYSYIVAPLTSPLDIVDLPQRRISPHTATVTTINGPSTSTVLTPRMILA